MEEKKITIIGLGYVGLPLAVEFSRKYKTVGFDINNARINELESAHDSTLEVENNVLKQVLELNKSNKSDFGFLPTINPSDIEDSNVYIITVPTPTDKNKHPVLIPLLKASETVGKVLKEGDIVIYESTVYPGATEDECIPVLEKFSGLTFNQDFYVGYSPERINPGDKERTVSKILKVTSGSTKSSAIEIDNLYKSIITAGTYLAPSIKVAEAAKVIENSQRDINIAFVNELAKIFNLLDIDTHEVLKAAETKWNFLPFKPGLVGGHCIGVDPYYLAHKAQEVGYNPEIILSGRRLNDSMGSYVANQVVKLMINKNFNIKGCNVLILGITFKENCPDVRNTKVVDIITELETYGIKITIFDPIANPEDVKKEYGVTIINRIPENTFESVILAVAHREFLKLDLRSFLKKDGVLYDVKGVLPLEQVDLRL